MDPLEAYDTEFQPSHWRNHEPMSMCPYLLSRSLLISLSVLLAVISAAMSVDAASVQSRPLIVPKGHAPGFTALNDQGSLTTFGNEIGVPLYRTNQILLNGSGVSIGDVNNDGRSDIVATSIGGPNALLVNQGNWAFENRALDAGISLDGSYCTGSVLADLDGDGDLDLLVASIRGGTFIFQNDGLGRFTDMTSSSGVLAGLGGMSIAVADYDLDGDLDFYVSHYRASALMDVPNARMNLGVKGGKKVITDFNGRPVTEPDLVNRFYVDERGGIGEYGEEDHFYRNLGNWRFERLSFIDGTFIDENGQSLTQAPFDWGLAVAFRDINQDGLPDLYVCNDFDTPDRIWINQGDGRFRALSRASMRQSSWFSMGVDFADVNRDGWDDFLTLDMLGSTHGARMTQLGDVAPAQHLIKNPLGRPQFLKTALFINDGQGIYDEVGQFAGLAATDWAWCPIFLDVDLDGWEDLLISNGNERDGRNLDVAKELKELRAKHAMSDDRIFSERMRFPRLPSPNLAYRNNRDGTFTELGQAWGFGHVGVSHGVALGDLDNDGDLDVVVNHLNEPLGIYRNNASQPRVSLRLNGRAPNTAGIGARVFFRVGSVSQAQEIMAGGRYLSSDDAIRVFGVPDNTEGPMSIEVHWPNGFRSIVSQVEANRAYEVSEPEPGGNETPSPRKEAIGEEKQWFVDISPRVKFMHLREAFDDFSRQPLLLRRYGDLGPGISWFDIDGDSYDDLVVGAARGGRLGIFRNNEGGEFAFYDRAPFDRPSSRDTTSVLGVQLRTKDPALIIGLSNYEDGLALGGTIGHYRFRAKSPVVIRGGNISSVGPLAMADWDRDGDLDLFVGARFIPGRIPESPESALFINEEGRFTEDKAISAELQSVGMVSGAVFTDIDGDAHLDLVLALEWGSIEVFLNREGRFERVTERWGIGGLKGWWNGVQAGDFNADGRMDIVASNWGSNTPYRRYDEQALNLYFGDFDNNSQVDLVLGAMDKDLGKRVPLRQLGTLARGLPALRQSFVSHDAFSKASTSELLERLKGDPTMLSAGYFQSTVFMNRADRFEAIPLPAKAQWSPAFGLAVADFDGNGSEDLFLAQNFFGVRNDIARYDGGRGLLLQGNGDGTFVAIPSFESGIAIYGEQRGAAVADLDHDGRVDLAVGQNGDLVKLYKNSAARPGLRVTLVGAEGNPTAVGASLWLSNDKIRGPQREVRAGGGYLSQDSPSQVLSLAGVATQLTIVWPGGKRTVHPLSERDHSLLVRSDGSIERN